ncbi:ribbon-helix-helix domain-containing protein [Nostoc sp. PA-18-2419]|uniref:ribbon-helix-helix domain-containing protein n=1 Tax=Nostoc sp. PA-18-2419 TaxID=2575443 RepID=UPI00110882A3|nr:CopG family transcriptional regulator [Nostoc sp. PA-18-2419]
MGGKPINKRITAFLPPDKAQFLEEWAKREHRAVGNLAAAILLNVIEEKQIQETGKDSAA